jgi:hypothetical protein
MGFDPQNAGQPLVNVHKRTTKVNIAAAIGIVIFFLIGLGYAVWKSGRTGPDRPVEATPVPGK